MSHTFYVFKSKHYKPDSCILNSRFLKLSEIACNKQKRHVVLAQHMIAVSNSVRSPRASQVRKSLGESEPETNAQSAEKLFEILNKADSSIVNCKEYTCSKQQSTQYKRYNEQLLKSGKIEVAALAHRGERKALIAPSFDGNNVILVSLFYDPMTHNGLYFGITYDIESKRFKKVPVLHLLNTFCYLNSMPFDLTDILMVSKLCFIFLIVCID